MHVKWVAHSPAIWLNMLDPRKEISRIGLVVRPLNFLKARGLRRETAEHSKDLCGGAGWSAWIESYPITHSQIPVVAIYVISGDTR